MGSSDAAFVFAFGAVLASAIALVQGPALLGLGLAVTAAVCWCAWLERHPTA